MRPQTSGFMVSGLLDLKTRPQSSKLMTSTQLRNLSAKQVQRNLEVLAKPSVDVQYQKFVPRNFGVLCDKGYFEQNKQLQLQKFGRAQSQFILKTKQVTNQPTKKQQIFKLIDVDARQRMDPEQLTEREKELQFKKQIMQILNDNINPVKEMVKTFNKNDNIIIVKFIPFSIRKKRSNKKSENSLTLNWVQSKKLLLINNAEEYILNNMSYEKKTISIDLSKLSSSAFITSEYQKQKDFEIIKDYRKFYITMPKVIVYCEDIKKHVVFPLSCLSIAEIAQSNLELLQDHMNELDTLSNQVIPQKQFPAKLLPGKLTKEEKVVKRILFHENEYCQLAFIPPCIKIMDKDKLLGSYNFTIQEFQNLTYLTMEKTIQEFLESVKIIATSNKRVSIMVQFNDVDIDKVKSNWSFGENGLLLEQNIQKEFKIIYTPCRFEFYNPTTSQKQSRILVQKDMESIFELNFNFSL